MKIKKSYTLLVVLTLAFVTLGYSQHKRYEIKNGFGIMGGLTQFDILTDNFDTKSQQGWLVGASATVDIPHKWYNISYAIQLSENKIGIASSPINPGVVGEEFIDYKMFAAQIALLMHIKTFGSHLTIDVGPMLQYNDRLMLQDDDQENFIISNYDNLTAQDIENISKFNFNGAIGATAGFGFLKLRAQYIYGFTNILNKLNDANLDTSGFAQSKFKGNQSMLVFGAMITF